MSYHALLNLIIKVHHLQEGVPTCSSPLYSDIPELQEQSGLTPHHLCPFFWHLSTCDAQHWRGDRGSGDSGPSREALCRQTSLGAARGATAEAAVKDSDTGLQSVGS